ncbi:MAG: hypothetical protein WBB82_01410 [Limnothrix sp.]
MVSMTPKSGVLLLLSCVCAIAAVGCVFEISSGEPDLGMTYTSLILAASIPLTIISFIVAVKDTRANQEE